MSMNLSKKQSRISLPSPLSTSTVEAFVLESERPGEEGLDSRFVSIKPFITQLVGSLLCHGPNNYIFLTCQLMWNPPFVYILISPHFSVFFLTSWLTSEPLSDLKHCACWWWLLSVLGKCCSNYFLMMGSIVNFSLIMAEHITHQEKLSASFLVFKIHHYT